MKYLFYLLPSLFFPIIKVALGFTTWNIIDLIGTVVMMLLWGKDRFDN